MSDDNTLQQLACIERNNGKEQLRVSVDEFTDDRGTAHRYISLRVWFKGERGDYLPSKKGLTVRKTEIMEVGKALKAGLDALNDDNRFARGNRQPTAPRQRPEDKEDATNYDVDYGF